MYITDIINVKFHKVEYDNLLEVLSNYLIITIVLLIILYIIIMSIVIFFYISRFKFFNLICLKRNSIIYLNVNILKIFAAK